MKQFLIFGLLVLIQVNFICGNWIQIDLDNSNLDDDYDDSSENINNVQNYQVLPWEPLPEYDDDIVEADDSLLEESNEDNDYTQNFQDSLQSWQPETKYDGDVMDVDDDGLQLLDDSKYAPSQQVNIRRRRSLRSIPFNTPKAALQRAKRNTDWFISDCTRDECRSRGNGWRALEQCGPAFCTCQNGNAYLQGCGQGLIYYAEKRLCTWYYNVPGC